MATPPENPPENIVTKETIPLLKKEKHRNGAIESTFPIESSPSINEPGKSPTTNVAPCAKYGNEEDFTSSTTRNTQRAKRKLMIACVLCVLFLIAEFVGA